MNKPNSKTRTAIRWTVVVVVLAALIYGALFESHTVFSLKDDSKKQVSGLVNTEMATYDGLMLRNGQVYDVWSLTPDSLQTKDCAT